MVGRSMGVSDGIVVIVILGIRVGRGVGVSRGICVAMFVGISVILISVGIYVCQAVGTIGVWFGLGVCTGVCVGGEVIVNCG